MCGAGHRFKKVAKSFPQWATLTIWSIGGKGTVKEGVFKVFLMLSIHLTLKFAFPVNALHQGISQIYLFSCSSCFINCVSLFGHFDAQVGLSVTDCINLRIHCDETKLLGRLLRAIINCYRPKLIVVFCSLNLELAWWWDVDNGNDYRTDVFYVMGLFCSYLFEGYCIVLYCGSDTVYLPVKHLSWSQASVYKVPCLWPSTVDFTLRGYLKPPQAQYSFSLWGALFSWMCPAVSMATSTTLWKGMNGFYFIFIPIYFISDMHQFQKEYFMKPKHAIILDEVRDVAECLREIVQCCVYCSTSWMFPLCVGVREGAPNVSDKCSHATI